MRAASRILAAAASAALVPLAMDLLAPGCALIVLGGPMTSVMAQEKQLRRPIEDEFSAVIVTIGAVRRVNHSAALQVTSYFAPLTEQYSLAEIRDYAASHYKMRKVSEWNGKGELVEIEGDDLFKLDDRFLRYDFIRLVFVYSNDWAIITGFTAVLGNRAS